KFPKQVIHFVDISVSIQKQFLDYFESFSNKLLALFFSSFKEVILIDTDTIPLINPDLFFESNQYKSSKSYFFRDRELNHKFPINTKKFFLNLFPNYNDTHFFDFNQINCNFSRILGNPSFNHNMESGIVVLDKYKYFNGILLSLVLQFWRPITANIHGEKELYWLSQLIVGNDQFQFNKNYAVSIGKLSPTTNEFSKIKANELCSTHPGHISDDNATLLWFNSGFLNCKNWNTWEVDFQYELESGLLDNNPDIQKDDPFTLIKYYTDPLRIDAFLIPARGINDEVHINTQDHYEPSTNWIKTKRCKSYLWCAYDLINGDEKNSEEKGKIVYIKETDKLLYNFYGDIWVYYHNSIPDI
ncbi:glycosyltransferase family 71 protein, partial [Ascoidea rubescens DSM 1968]